MHTETVPDEISIDIKIKFVPEEAIFTVTNLNELHPRFLAFGFSFVDKIDSVMKFS